MLVAVESPLPAGMLAVQGIRRNPAAGAFAVNFTLRGNDPAKLEVFDVAGRRVLGHDLKAMQLERQTLVLGECRSLAAEESTASARLRLVHEGPSPDYS